MRSRRRRVWRIGCCASVAALLAATITPTPPPAHAADVVTYEVISDSIPAADIEYIDQAGRHWITAIPLPWRLDVTLDDAQGPTGQGAQLRADWRRIRGRAAWVTVRISEGGRALCASTLDVGAVTCYGNTPHFS